MTDTAIAHPTFLISRLMAGTDLNESTYNKEDYWKRDILFEPERLEEAQAQGHGRPVVTLDFPRSHKQYDMFWAGMDVGITRIPSELLVLGEYTPTQAERIREEKLGVAAPLAGRSRLKLLTRLRLIGFPTANQLEAVMAVIEFYRPRAFALDQAGVGLPLAQLAEKRAPGVIVGYHAASEVVVDIAQRGPGEEVAITRNAKEHATDVLRELVDSRRLMLPYDANLLGQMTGETWHYSDAQDVYGRRRRIYSQSEEQGGLDALRIACFGRAMQSRNRAGHADV